MVYGASKRPCLCSKTAVLKRICDRQRAQNADMAEEMTEYTSVNVMTQAATSILAQANERPSTVLQILQ